MTSVAILSERTGAGRLTYRALAGGRQTTGNTAGEALDALTAILPDDDTGTMVVIQNFRPDRFFTKQQCERLESLMARWRAARDSGRSLPDDEQAELDALVEAEVRASGERAGALADQLRL